MSTTATAGPGTMPASRLYRAVWRWHFYAGLYVIPFLLMLAVTGFFMMLFTTYLPEYGDRLPVAGQGTPLAPLALAEKARTQVAADATVKEFILPYDAATPVIVKVKQGEAGQVLALNPYTGDVLRSTPEEGTWNLMFERIHGSLMAGDVGDWLIEIAASLGIVLVVTGLYLWWPRGERSFAAALVPDLSRRGRSLWKTLHESTGAWLSILMLFFMVTGLAWTGVWGGKIVQTWSTFPAQKWDAVPLSDKTHVHLNGSGQKEVPWGLEQTPLPKSGSAQGVALLPPGTAVNLNGLVEIGRGLGIGGRFRVIFPQGDDAVWTLSQNSMSYDGAAPTQDRTVHVDQYTGKVLADVRYDAYSAGAKAMAVGIALHEGQLGLWNVLLNGLFCLAIVFICISGVVMWWKRRPVGELGSPRYPREFRLTVPIVLAAMALAFAFPLGGLAILLFAIADFLLPKRLKEAGA